MNMKSLMNNEIYVKKYIIKYNNTTIIIYRV